ncbi:MAG: acetolactate synthase small subunit [Alphaproteobacteria bacterium]|jgi:acetolactate synthase-1/3 small subunit|nr:acetolactate synthase small subunit [Alphaproteobacteria bacterium]|tara:strand:- start:2164 stop:2700 length:537 start_codon:yes stop_codon:yes gene_type:complete
MSDASVYPEPNNTFKQSKRNVLSIIVDNEPGILARIVGLFSGRGYNIEALNVTVVDIKENLSRITLETIGEQKVIGQIIAHLEKLVPVHSAINLADLNESYEAEISLIKIIYENEDQNLKTLALADIYRTRTVTKKDGIVIYEISGTSERVNKFLDDLNGINGIKVEIVRSGPIGLGV